MPRWQILLPMQGTRAWSPIWGDPTCLGGPTPTAVSHSCRACALLHTRGSAPGVGRPRGGGHGYAPQSSRLENSTSRGGWRAAVQGVTEGSLQAHFPPRSKSAPRCAEGSRHLPRGSQALQRCIRTAKVSKRNPIRNLMRMSRCEHRWEGLKQRWDSTQVTLLFCVTEH